MINNRRILALIPARGGSKGIKDKNITLLCDKPLIAYTIEAAISSQYIDSVVVTTDSPKIAEIALEHGAEVPFMRPTELSSDTSKTIDAVLHAVAELRNIGREYDDLILLQPTQPLRTTLDIDNSIEIYNDNKFESLVSVCSVSEHPLFVRTVNKDNRLEPLINLCSTVRRQDLPIYYKINGCIYINQVVNLNACTSFNDNTLPFIMTKESSIDIDEPYDLQIANHNLLRRNIL